MKYLHIMHNDKFNASILEFFEKNFDMSEHIFIFWGYSSKIIYPIPLRSNIVTIKNINDIVFLIMNMFAAKKVYFHGLFMHFWLDLLVAHKWVLSKSNWIVWGGDLYFYKYRPQNEVAEIIEQKRRMIIPEFAELSCAIPGDYHFAKKIYNIKGALKEYAVPLPINISMMDKLLGKNHSIDNRFNAINILVGHSAAEEIEHIKAFKTLERFKENNIRIICPLSYGDAEYGQSVQNAGREIFREKFVPILKYMTPEHYLGLLNAIDIGVFFQQRQQGGSNIATLLYLGKKVYLHKENTLFGYWQECLGMDIKNVDKLEKESFDEFIYMNENSRIENRDKISFHFDEQCMKKIWQEQHFNL